MKPKKLHIIVVLLCLVTAAKNSARAQGDQKIPHVRTLGLALLGTAIFGAGVSYDHSFARSENGYAYGRVGVSLPAVNWSELYPLAGVGYCHAVAKSKKFFAGAGLNAGFLIDFHPTPKALREHWDSIGFYGGNYVYPVMLILMPELSVGYLKERWFCKLQFTPFLPYEKYGRNEFSFFPWGGVTAGLRFSKHHNG
jgi:hypothetical protein